MAKKTQIFFGIFFFFLGFPVKIVTRPITRCYHFLALLIIDVQNLLCLN